MQLVVQKQQIGGLQLQVAAAQAQVQAASLDREQQLQVIVGQQRMILDHHGKLMLQVSGTAYKLVAGAECTRLFVVHRWNHLLLPPNRIVAHGVQGLAEGLASLLASYPRRNEIRQQGVAVVWNMCSCHCDQ